MKVKFPFEDGGVYCLNMSVGELVDRHVGRNVGKSVSPKTACFQNINPVINHRTIINSPIHLNECIKEISTGAPFSKFRRNVLY